MSESSSQGERNDRGISAAGACGGESRVGAGHGDTAESAGNLSRRSMLKAGALAAATLAGTQAAAQSAAGQRAAPGTDAGAGSPAQAGDDTGVRSAAPAGASGTVAGRPFRAVANPGASLSVR